ncbi:hypothetical protein MNBD_ALPHA01-2166 [hydrothermal vent metagenome]|uniref:Periplasmic nitrate reductase component NapD n=1 Tax=hydrothermal vent metagenome TaxID=652676 RepID=A0A3B0T2J2_9ZZZZ
MNAARINISGVLVSVNPKKIEQVKKTFEEMDGVEIHLQTDDGQLIVTVEEEHGGEIMLAVHRTEGVIAANLVYHNFELFRDIDPNSDEKKQSGMMI